MKPGALSRSKAVLRANIIKSLAHPSRIQMVAALESGEMTPVVPRRNWRYLAILGD